jgi:hypothetical protein
VGYGDSLTSAPMFADLCWYVRIEVFVCGEAVGCRKANEESKALSIRLKG